MWQERFSHQRRCRYTKHLQTCAMLTNFQTIKTDRLQSQPITSYISIGPSALRGCSLLDHWPSILQFSQFTWNYKKIQEPEAISVAQWLRCLAFNQWVRGSSLRRGNIKWTLHMPFSSTNLIRGFLWIGCRTPLPSLSSFPVLHALFGKWT